VSRGRVPDADADSHARVTGGNENPPLDSLVQQTRLSTGQWEEWKSRTLIRESDGRGVTSCWLGDKLIRMALQNCRNDGELNLQKTEQEIRVKGRKVVGGKRVNPMGTSSGGTIGIGPEGRLVRGRRYRRGRASNRARN